MNQLISRIKHKFTLSVALTLALLGVFGCGSTTPTPLPPSWTKSKVLAIKEDHPSKILVDKDFLYYVTGGTVASQQDGTNTIKWIDLKSGAVSVLVKGGQQIPDEVLAQDEQFIYWSDGDNILRVPKAGGESKVLVTKAAKPAEMLVDNDHIYWLLWADQYSPPQPVMFAPKQGGAAKPLTPPESAPNGLSLDSNAVDWVTAKGIRTAPKSGGAATFLYTNPTPDQGLIGLVQDADNFYFTQMTKQGATALMRLTKHTKTLTQLAPSVDWTYGFIADNTYVYYFDKEDSGSFSTLLLQKVAKQGGEPLVLDKGAAGWTKYVAVDQTQLYFTDIDQVYSLGK